MFVSTCRSTLLRKEFLFWNCYYLDAAIIMHGTSRNLAAGTRTNVNGDQVVDMLDNIFPTKSVVLVSGLKLAMETLLSMNGARRGADMSMLSMATHTMLQVLLWNALNVNGGESLPTTLCFYNNSTYYDILTSWRNSCINLIIMY